MVASEIETHGFMMPHEILSKATMTVNGWWQNLKYPISNPKIF